PESGDGGANGLPARGRASAEGRGLPEDRRGGERDRRGSPEGPPGILAGRGVQRVRGRPAGACGEDSRGRKGGESSRGQRRDRGDGRVLRLLPPEVPLVRLSTGLS